jgi:hypothetical protein
MWLCSKLPSPTAFLLTTFCFAQRPQLTRTNLLMHAAKLLIILNNFRLVVIEGIEVKQ